VQAESKFQGTGHILIAVEQKHIITVLELSTKQSSFLLLVCFIDLEIRTRRSQSGHIYFLFHLLHFSSSQISVCMSVRACLLGLQTKSH